MRQIFSDWQVSAVMRYQSGALITAPGSNNNLGTYLAGASTQYMARVPGQPLYLADPNGKIDPTQAASPQSGGLDGMRSHGDLRLRRAALHRFPPAAIAAGGYRFRAEIRSFGQRGHPILRNPNGDVQSVQPHCLPEHRCGKSDYQPHSQLEWPAYAVGSDL